ncbi:hypothetical protein JKF63_01356 [Porcisia hertigi]|uniref:Uncharacterized protein n=1 Tax=Porcisia hertigi TaxID=2761500 RepID=A0A836I956_9TRYP|nr:hypothetical protein JKF63_01356 [Porcisia hertigi]
MFDYLETRRDDEHFAVRLEEAKKEMDTLLLKTSRTVAEVRMGVPLHFYPSAVPGRVEPVTPTSPGDPLRPPQTQTDLARSVASAELSQWTRSHLPGLIASLVEAQVQQHLTNLRESVEELRVREAKIEKAAKDVAEQVRVHRLDMHTAFAAAQSEMQRAMEEHQRGVDRKIEAWAAELRRVQEDVLAQRRQGVSAGDRQERQISEALQRQQAHVQEAIEALEHEFQEWRQKTSRASLKEARGLQAQHRTLENHVAQFQGMLASVADMVTHSTADVRHLMEDAVSRSSEVRLCRRDVNRLEMLVQCSSLHTALLTGGTGPSDAKGNSTPSSVSPALFNHLTQEMARLSDSLYTTVSRIDGLDRQIQHIEMAVAQGVRVGGGQNTNHSRMRGVDDESLYCRSFVSTRRPSSSHLSNATGSHGYRASTGFTSAPSLSEYDDNADVTPTYSSAAENQFTTTSVDQVPTTQPSRVSHAPGRGNASGTSRPRVPLTLSSSAPTHSTYDLQLSHHLRSGSSNAEGSAVDSQSIPVMVSDSRLERSVVDDEMIRQSAAAGISLRRPQQRGVSLRDPLVETIESDAHQGGVAKPTASKSTLHGMPGFDAAIHSSLRASEYAAHSPAERYVAASLSASLSLATSGLDATRLAETPSPPIADSEGAAVAGEGSVKNRKGSSDHRERSIVEAANSPEDSYVSDAPAADLDDSAVKSADPFRRETWRTAQYTPAKGSDSESERENLAMARSALD